MPPGLMAATGQAVAGPAVTGPVAAATDHRPVTGSRTVGQPAAPLAGRPVLVALALAMLQLVPGQARASPDAQAATPDRDAGHGAAGPGPSAAAAPAAVRDCDACPHLVLVQGGRYRRGSEDGELSEIPVRSVMVRSFLAGRFEVTRDEFARFVAATGHRVAPGCLTPIRLDPDASWQAPGFAQAGDHPVVCISWHDAAAYAQWLGRLTGRRYRLLSEAEWEYAARAGSTAKWSWGEDPGAACGFANSADRRHFQEPQPTATGQALARAGIVLGTDCDDGHARTSPAGAFRGNGFGLHDMAGNVWEWVADCWNDSYRAVPVSGLPATGGECARRVQRGGSCADGPHALRPAFREHAPAGERSTAVGFRIARDID